MGHDGCGLPDTVNMAQCKGIALASLDLIVHKQSSKWLTARGTRSLELEATCWGEPMQGARNARITGHQAMQLGGKEALTLTLFPKGVCI